MTPPPAAAHHSGLPQFDLTQWPGQIVWALLIFGVLYVLFARVFVPRVSGAIDTREDRIAGDIGDARRLRDEAQAASDAADREMAEARARAQKVAADAKAEAKKKADLARAAEDARLAETLAAAEARIAASRAEAMTHVGGIAGDTAQAIVEKLTGRAPSPAEVSEALATVGAA